MFNLEHNPWWAEGFVAAPWPAAPPTGLRALQRQVEAVVDALAAACAISSQLEVVPETEALPGLHPLHTGVFIPMSYHALTALGAARAMAATGRTTVPLLVLVVGCLIRIGELAGAMPTYIEQLAAAAGRPYRAAVAATARWANQIVPLAEAALQTVKGGVSPFAWARLLAEGQRAERAIAHVRDGHTGFGPES